MESSRKKNAKRNAVSGMLNMTILMILPFISRTIILRELGTAYLGLGSLFTAIFQVLNMAELGFSNAITFNLYKPLAEKNDKLVCAYLAYYRKAYQIIGILVLFVGGGLIFFLPFLVKGSYPKEINIYVLYIIYLLNASLSYFFFAYKSVLLSATQRKDILSNINSVLAIIKNVSQFVILIVFKNYYLFTLCILVTSIVNNLVVEYSTRKRYPQYICKGQLTTVETQNVVKVVKGAAISKLSSASRNSFDSIVLSMFCGLTDVTVYSNYYYIFSTVLGIIQVFTEAMAAGIGNSIAIEKPDKNYNDYKKFNYYFSCIGSWFTICLIFMYQPFMKIWTKKEELLAMPVTMVLFVLYFYVEQLGVLRTIYTRACGIWWKLKSAALFETISNLILNFVLGYYWGMNGILVATIITVLIFSIVVCGRETIKDCFKCNAVEYFRITTKYFVVTVVCIYIMQLVFKMLAINGFIGVTLICAIVPPLLLIGFSLLDKQTRKYISQIKEIIR